MSNLDELRAQYEEADKAASELTGEYERKRQEGLDAVKAEYKDRLDEAVENARISQKAYADAEAIQALLDRPDGQEVAQRLVSQGGLSQEQVDAAFHSDE